MGYGDELMTTGIARGAAARGKRIAAGDGRQIKWGPWSEQIFRHNPNIAPEGSEGATDLEWCHHYKGHRLYVKHHADRWYFDRSWRVTPGEMFFSADELDRAASIEPGFVLIESRVKVKPNGELVYPNKQWPVERYRTLAQKLSHAGHPVRQFHYGDRPGLLGVPSIKTKTFRDALAALSRAALYIGPEGGLSHGAAAVNIPAVVIFGGFPDPQVTGYDHHINLTGGVEPCGSIKPCNHCRLAMAAITVETVFHKAMKVLNAGKVRDARGVGERVRMEARG